MRNSIIMFVALALVLALVVNCKEKAASPEEEKAFDDKVNAALAEYSLVTADYILGKAEGIVDSGKLGILCDKRKSVMSANAWGFLIEEVAPLVSVAHLDSGLLVEKNTTAMTKMVNEVFLDLWGIWIFQEGKVTSIPRAMKALEKYKQRLDVAFRTDNPTMDEAITFVLRVSAQR